MAKRRQNSFPRWLEANGAEVLPLCPHEYARFRAHGILCIVYNVNRKGRQAFVPELAREAWMAFGAGQTLDLSNPADDDLVEDWHAMGIALCAVADRAKAGEAIDVQAEAVALHISPSRLQRSMHAFGATAQGGEAP